MALAAALAPAPAAACDFCRPAVEAAIFDASFWPRAGAMLLPFAVVGLVVAAAHRLAPRFLGGGDR